MRPFEEEDESGVFNTQQCNKKITPSQPKISNSTAPTEAGDSCRSGGGLREKR